MEIEDILGFADGITNHGSHALEMRETGVHIVSKPITSDHKRVLLRLEGRS